MAKLKVFTGNYDGVREGLVVSTSKKKAVAAIGTSYHDFKMFWDVDDLEDPAKFDPDTLYTRLMFYGTGDWHKGRCSCRAKPG